MQLSKSKDSSIRPLPAESTPGSGGPQWPLMHCSDTNQPFRRPRASDVLGARFILLSLPHWLPAGTQLVIILAPRSEEKREPQGIMRRGRSRLVEGVRVWIWVGHFMQSGIHVNYLIGNGWEREIGPWQETGLAWFSSPFNIFFFYFSFYYTIVK